MAQGCVCTVLATKSAPDELFRCGKVLWVGNELGQACVWSRVARLDALARHQGCRGCPSGVPSTSRGVRQSTFAMSQRLGRFRVLHSPLEDQHTRGTRDSYSRNTRNAQKPFVTQCSKTVCLRALLAPSRTWPWLHDDRSPIRA